MPGYGVFDWEFGFPSHEWSCSNSLSSLARPGEYADRIDNAGELLTSFLEVFGDENIQVQLQLLTAIVKLFLKKPAGNQELVQRVLSLATQVSPYCTCSAWYPGQSLLS